MGTSISGAAGVRPMATFDPGGSLIVTAANELKIWTSGGNLLVTLQGSPADFTGWVDFSSDGSLLAAARGHSLPKVWPARSLPAPDFPGDSLTWWRRESCGW